MIVVAARPSMGKTALALGFVVAALNHHPDAPVQLYSLEMPARALIYRLLALLGLTPAALRALARRASRRLGKPALVVLDYLQLMQGTTRHENRHLEIAEISGSRPWPKNSTARWSPCPSSTARWSSAPTNTRC